MNLDTDITYLKGVGPQRASLLKIKGISTVEDLLYYMPFRYEDRSNVKPIAKLAPGETATVVVTISGTQTFFGLGIGRRACSRPARWTSPGGLWVCKWFRGDYLQSILRQGQQVAFYGKVEWDSYSQELSLFHPEYEILDDDSEANLHLGRIVPIYEAAGRLNTRVLRGFAHRALDALRGYEDPLPESLRRRLGLPLLDQALLETHFPPPGSDLAPAERFPHPGTVPASSSRSFFIWNAGLRSSAARLAAPTALPSVSSTARARQIKRILPFKPTGAQKRVLKDIATDMSQPAPMNRLLQGDVGSGKTIVAVEAAVIALENDYQVAVMAPTEILATQHYLYFKHLLEPAGYVVVCLTGSLTSREKAKLKRMAAEGVAPRP